MAATLHAQFAQIAQAAPRLRREFQYLVDAHAAFQSQPAMRGMSVSANAIVSTGSRRKHRLARSPSTSTAIRKCSPTIAATLGACAHRPI